MIPDGMTTAKLLQIADYLDECDSIILQVLQRAREEGHDIPESALEFISGKEMQADLRRWAEDIA